MYLYLRSSLVQEGIIQLSKECYYVGGEMSMNNLFTIDCGELLLRELRIEDVDANYELTSHPEVYDFCQIGVRLENKG